MRLIEFSDGYNARYAPTGHIVFARSAALWAVPFDLERLEKIGPEVPIVPGVQTDGNRGHTVYAFSDDGLLVYLPGVDVWGATALGRNLVWVDREGREELLDDTPRPYTSARLSPDGRQVAVAFDDNGNEDIWVYDLGRASFSRVTTDPGTDNSPLWSLDGNRIYFRSNRDGGGIFRKAVDGTGPVEQILAGAQQTPQSFSPDGAQLVYQQGPLERLQDIRILSLEGDYISRSLIQTEEFSELFGQISPDGQWIAYESDETGLSEIYVRPFPNVEDGKWPIARGSFPVWSHDGRELFYRTDEAVMVVSVEVGQTFLSEPPEELFAGDYLFRAPGKYGSVTYDVSADGRFLMIKGAEQIEQTNEQTTLSVVHNWFEELNRLAPPSP